MKKTLTIFFTLLSGMMLAQNHPGDCEHALVMNAHALSVSEVKGPGEMLEMVGNYTSNTNILLEEHNTVWLSFTADETGDLEFNIAPKHSMDDWNFVLYKGGLEQCRDIANHTLQPVRSNLSRSDENIGGITGLKSDAQHEFEGSGFHPNMSKGLYVEKGDPLLLAVDIMEANQHGFDFNWSIVPGENDMFLEETHGSDDSFGFVDMTDIEDNGEKIQVNFVVLMEGTEAPVQCHAEVVGVQWMADGLIYDDVEKFTVDVPKDKWFFINVKRQGYTFGTEKYKASDDLAGTTQKIFITEAGSGKHIVLKEIVFRENTTHLLPSSINALDQLILFMQEHPQARIEIQGHVNAPDRENDVKVKKFSLKRAEQIKSYLVDSGIDGKRIEVSGKGNEFMIYPDPKNYDQEKANRRVEIEILSL